MNEDIKARWVAALRSDEYEQGKDWLCKDGKYCCLGVLSDLAVKDGVIDAPEATTWDEAALNFDGEPALLPEAVAEWAGIMRFDEHYDGVVVPAEDPIVPFGDEEKTLAELNDEGKTFSELADLIEEHL